MRVFRAAEEWELLDVPQQQPGATFNIHLNFNRHYCLHRVAGWRGGGQDDMSQLQEREREREREIERG
jgi:hypothetical protein